MLTKNQNCFFLRKHSCVTCSNDQTLNTQTLKIDAFPTFDRNHSGVTTCIDCIYGC